MSQRIEKMNELVKNQLAQLILKEIEFPENSLVTITKVATSPDLKVAKVYITVIPENTRGTALKILQKSSRFLHHGLNNILKTKFTPNLNFFIDDQEVFADEVEKILDEIKKK
jgi:ribosome-binding factor A